mgnify:CR=1 FL=1
MESKKEILDHLIAVSSSYDKTPTPYTPMSEIPRESYEFIRNTGLRHDVKINPKNFPNLDAIADHIIKNGV